MTLKVGAAPFLRQDSRHTWQSGNVLIALAPLFLFSVINYGPRPLVLGLTGIVTAMLCEAIACLLMRRPLSLADGTAAVTGALIGALMSPASPYWLPGVAAAFAIWVVKMPFGGAGRNLFNPAAAGVAVITQCFYSHLFTYPDAGRGVALPLGTPFGSILPQIAVERSPAAQIAGGGSPVYHWSSMLLGDFAGPIGATAIAVLVACGLYLFLRRAASPWIVLPYLAVCALTAVLFPRVSGGWQNSLMLELCSGGLLFGGIFLLTDPVTAPRHWLARVLYGMLAGALVMLLRHFGRPEHDVVVCFAVLLVNAFAPVLDRWCWGLTHRLRHGKEGRHA